MCIAYVYNVNAILVLPMKTCETTSHLKAFKDIYKYLTQQNFKPKLHVMDNKCSKTIEDYIIKENNTRIQFVEPQEHHVNAAECAVQRFKNHFIAGLCTVNKNFPLQQWDELIPQAQDSLNLLRRVRNNPRLSAYAVLEEKLHFNKMPLAPLGTQLLL